MESSQSSCNGQTGSPSQPKAGQDRDTASAEQVIQGFDDPNAKPFLDTDTAGNAARRIQEEAQFLANMSNGQKGVIQKLQERNDRQRETIVNLKERDAMHQSVIESQSHRIELMRTTNDRAYGSFHNATSATIRDLRTQLDAKEACIKTLTEQLAYARKLVDPLEHDRLRRRAEFGDRMAFTAGVNIS